MNAIQKMATHNSLVEEIEQLLWKFEAKELSHNDIEAIFKEVLRNFNSESEDEEDSIGIRREGNDNN